MIPPYIDFSQYNCWQNCPWDWVERYVNGWRPIYKGQREDPYCIGSLVAQGLESLHKTGNPIIPPSTLEEFNPTREGLSMAMGMLETYSKDHYPRIPFNYLRSEEAIQFPLPSGEKGVAKLDLYFYTRPMVLPTGLGVDLQLEEGWYIQEFKTKAPSIDRQKWIRDWAMNMQADFQMHAFQAKLGHLPKGMLVTVLEKPNQYIPKRKCKGCKSQFEYRSYLPTHQPNTFICGSCGYTQVLEPPDYKDPTPTQIFTIQVTRSHERLQYSLELIDEIRQKMLDYQNNLIPNFRNCNSTMFGECPFLKAHEHLLPVEKLIQVETQFTRVDPLKYLNPSI